MENTGVNHSCTTFIPPTVLHAGSSCTSFNEWKYGLQALPDATTSYYIAPFATDPTVLAAAVHAYVTSKDVRFIFGNLDVCNCNCVGFKNDATCYVADAACSPDATGGPHCCDTYPDTRTVNAVDHSCAAMLEGSNRLQRGLNYVLYLANLNNGTAPPHGFFDGGHSNAAFYASDLFKEWAY